MQTLEDPKIPMLEHELKNSEITNDNLREELIKVNEQLQLLKNKDAERKMDGLGSSLVEPDSKPKSQEQLDKESAEQLKVYEQGQYISELEGRLAAVNSHNEDLVAEVEEAGHWVYNRG